MNTETIMAKKNLIEYVVGDGVAIVTLNDPPANTYSYQMMQQLDARILEREWMRARR